MHLIVTGASGFVGRTLIGSLAAGGHTGLAVSRRKIEHLPRGWAWQARDQVLVAERPSGQAPVDWLVHLEVKQHLLRPSATDRLEFKAVNVGGTEQWLEWCTRNATTRFALFSTIKAVGDSSEVQDESTSTLPDTPYGQSKREAEEKVRGWAGLDAERQALILRPAVIYGPGNRGNIFAMIDALSRDRFLFVGGGHNVKSLVCLANVVAATTFLVERRSTGCEVFNLVDLESFTVRELATMMSRELAAPAPSRSMPAALAWPVAWLGDVALSLGVRFPITRARLKALVETTHFTGEKLVREGFRHPCSTRDGIADMVRWYRESPN